MILLRNRKIILPNSAYWLLVSSRFHPNIYQVGIRMSCFSEEIFNNPILNTTFYLKANGKIVDKSFYLGSILNSNLPAIHFHAPMRGRIHIFNKSL